jgi:uncharacterized protein (DUF4415 family)
MQKNNTIVRHTFDEIDEMLRRGEDETDPEYVSNLTYEEIETSVDEDDEGPFDHNHVFTEFPKAKRQMTIRLDGDVIDWFKAQGKGYQTRMNAVLRQYMDLHRSK